MNWRWSLVAIVVALSLARWASEANRLGQEAAREEAEARAAARAVVRPAAANYPAGDGQVPSGYPLDVPVFEKAEITETVVAPKAEHVSWVVVFNAEAEEGELERWYGPQLEARGWRVTRILPLPASANGNPGRVIAAAKGDRRLEIFWAEGDQLRSRKVSQILEEPFNPGQK